MGENTENIKHGMQLDEPIPKITFGKMIYDNFLSSKITTEVMVDAFTNQKMSVQQLLEDSCNLAEALRVNGYASNTVLAIVSENSLQFFTPVFASLFNKSIACLLNSSSTHFELKHCLNITKPKIVFCSYKSSRQLIDVKKELKFIEKIIIIDSNKKVKGTTNLNDFVDSSLKGGKIQVSNFNPMQFDPVTTPALVLYSSGTTGLPKGVTLSHYNMVVAHTIGWKPEFDRSNPQSSLGFAPFYHSLGLNAAFFAFFNTRRLIVMKRFDEDVFLRSIQDYRVQMVALPPPLMVLLAKSPKVKKYDLSSLIMVGSGAAAVRKHIQEAVGKRINQVSTPQGYGLTETTFGVLMLLPGLNKPESVGFLVPMTSCKVVDPETGKTLGPNQPGELWFKGPLIMMGYYNDEKSTKETITDDGWLKTGDIGYYDDEDYFFIVDRIKELIKYKGFQVAPAELEGILLSHPKIADVAVVGRPDERSGELPTAFVVKKTKISLTEKEVEDFVADLVSPQKRLSGGVIFVSEIPKTQTGKILRKELKKTLIKKHKYKSKL